MRAPKIFHFMSLYSYSFWCHKAPDKREVYFKNDCLTVREMKALRDWLTKAIEWMEENR